MIKAANLGYPRLGRKRELKRALESYWRDKITEAELLDQTKALRLANWKLQAEAGVDYIPSNDFSLYDHVLDTTAMVGAVPPRYRWTGEYVDLRTYFAMARGTQKDEVDVPAMEMTKWFDTNYHYIVPEFEAGQQFRLGSTKVIDEFLEAKQAGIHTRPVMLGPVSYLLLGKSSSKGLNPLALLPNLLPVYKDVLKRLADAGTDWVQLDEPCLVLDLNNATQEAYKTAYAQLSQATDLELMLATYFGDLRDNLWVALELPVNGLHIDLVRAPGQLDEVLPQLPEGMVLSLGVVNGRNVWRTDLDRTLELINRAAEKLGPDRVQIAPSCSLLFSPYDLDLETDLDDELRSWLAFAKQKIGEIGLLKRAANDGRETVAAAFAVSRAAIESRRTSERTYNPAVRQRTAAITPAMMQRRSNHATRKALQSKHIQLPYFPTTTIGSFPQTAEVRAKRAAFREKKITAEAYHAFLKAEIERTIRKQEEMGLDVLVHGEFERTDMVEYFGERFTGVAFTKYGWVQSYGSRGVRPPIIYGDVARLEPMTVEWSTYAQSLTDRPMKGMLTGPVTILEWSFVRDDQPHAETCQQIALAIRDEVLDLEKAGIKIIQIDEPAIREGLPLRHADWDDYLQWAIDCFRLASAGVRDETQIHTHMCYSEFNDIIEAIERMDADVISIEGSRSKMELLDAFTDYQYPNDIGPGIYDIHSPRVPSAEEIKELLNKALVVLKPEQLWVNPDCGLKTRGWKEVEISLKNMVEAARALRVQVGDKMQTAR
jgi:5-methyltetrahydropteroyltriglutamate--homocysteine methyltransferase